MSFDVFASMLSFGLSQLSAYDYGLRAGFVSELIAAFRYLAVLVIAVLLLVKLKGGV